jgi:O-antigen/teichoic acid export membrane protein
MLGAAFISFKRADFQLGRTLVFQLGKMVIIIGVASVLGSFGILFSWGIAIMLATIFGLFYFLPRLIGNYRPVLKIDRSIDKEMIRFALTNYFSGALANMPSWILPLLIINLLGATSNAQFFIGWSVGSIVTAIPFSISTSVYAEGSNQIESMRKNLKKSVVLIILLLIPSEIIMFIFAHFILSFFGSAYANGGTYTLRLIALSAIPSSVTLLYLALVQVQKHLSQIILVSGGNAIGILLFGYAFVRIFGIDGASIACLLSDTLIAIGVAPFLLKYLITKELR